MYISNTETLNDLNKIALPEQTDSYMPVSHADLVKYVETEVADMLPNFTLVKNNFETSNKGQYLFGMAQFKNGNDYVGPTIGYRNSYNKEFSVGFAFGANVFICSNGMFTGDIVIAKKHTPNVWDSVRQVVADNVHKVESSFRTMEDDVEFMRNKKVSKSNGYSILGVLRGHNVLAPRVFEKALSELNQPAFKEHADGSLMEVYNACTEALKIETLPTRAMSQRVKLHDIMKEQIFPILN